jgi:hypothetical protein
MANVASPSQQTSLCLHEVVNTNNNCQYQSQNKGLHCLRKLKEIRINPFIFPEPVYMYHSDYKKPERTPIIIANIRVRTRGSSTALES